MSNIILTTECNKKCPYCFANNSTTKHMTFQRTYFKKAIDWLAKDKSGLVSRIGILGGEPTLHPKFVEFIGYILSKKLNTIIFTNGIIKNNNIIYDIIKTAEENEVKHTNQLCFCVNINDRKYRNYDENQALINFLKILGKVSTISFNIFEPNFKYTFLIDTIHEYNMIRNIRLGLAMPLKNKNRFLNPRDYKIVANNVINLINRAGEYKINIDLDCGFPKCMFTNDQLSILNSGVVKNVSFDCGPTIDIYPNLEIASCFPLTYKFKVKLEDFENYKELYDYWKKQICDLPPLYDKCYNCKDYLNTCSGGCKAHKAYGEFNINN